MDAPAASPGLARAARRYPILASRKRSIYITIFTLASFSSSSGSPSTYFRESPLAQWRSPFWFCSLKASKKTWPKWPLQRGQ